MEKKVIFTPKRPVPVDPQSEGGSPQKKAKNSPLHELHVVPITFLEDAVSHPETFLGTGAVGGSFGLRGEAYLRQCHKELLAEIMKEAEAWQNGDCMRMVEVRGSSGIGKSAFLAYTIAHVRLHGDAQSFAIFHSRKDQNDGRVSNLLDDVRCSVWIDGELKIDKQLYANVEMRQRIIDEYMPKLGAIFMDGCSPTIGLEGFTGFLVIAASPSVTTEGYRKLLAAKRAWAVLYMPPWTLDESLGAGKLLGEHGDVIRDNFKYMPGIVRYSFDDGAAKDRVLLAVKNIDPDKISSMVASQHTDKDTEKSMVHSLVRWEVGKKLDGSYCYREDVRFELVSRYAERLVAKKLSVYDSTRLDNTRRSLQTLCGAEGYAGALFEAFAIRKFLAGGSFVLQSVDGDKKATHTIDVPRIKEPVVVESNTLSTATVPLKSVHTPAENGTFVPNVLWPTTTNFPTFDAYYFDKGGDVCALQMTIADTHVLKNNGAFQTKEYLSRIKTAKKPYKAVFVVPKDELRAGYKKQAFTGNVMKGKQISMAEAQATKTMNQCFKQWVIELES